jgi:hypothetical protein
MASWLCWPRAAARPVVPERGQRTNRYNVHPILAGVYYDMFYHHGAGSRRAYLRPMMSSGYYDHLVPDHLDQEESLFQELAKDPVAFIARLRGVAF